MLKITFEKPKIFGVAQEAKNALGPKEKPKKKEKPQPWTYKDRLLVFGVLLATLILGLYFWYKGQGGILPTFNFDFGGFGFQRTVDLN